MLSDEVTEVELVNMIGDADDRRWTTRKQQPLIVLCRGARRADWRFLVDPLRSSAWR